MPKKTQPNPYEALGVDKDADPATIKRAYRGKAKGKHPDAGGSDVEFAPIAEAYRILSTPALKAAYDQTGEVDEKPMDVKVRENLIAAFRNTPGLEDNKSILQAVRAQFEGAIANSASQRAILADQRRKWEKKREKVTAKEGLNCFQLVVDHELQSIAQQIPLLEGQEELFRACLAALETYEEDWAAPKQIPMATYTISHAPHLYFDPSGRPIERR